MHVSEQRHHSWIVKLKAAFLPFGPRAQVFPQLLVATDGPPEHVVLHGVTVQNFHGAPYRHRKYVGDEQQAFLVHGEWFGRRFWFARRVINPNHGVSTGSGHFAANGAAANSTGLRRNRHGQQYREKKIFGIQYHVPSIYGQTFVRINWVAEWQASVDHA